MLAGYGPRFAASVPPVWLLAAYWGVFLLLLLLALYLALVDLRFIRLQYLLGRREIFYDTLGSEEFRQALRKAQEEQREQR
ncbi:MAG: hypothetical protein HYV26_13240 [Candidatus Hydrogenedentes bacterium]|nr:hypothetical protein [Candidatus Hydrogenedentota bacterium]MBI3118293.1 hypothetical protein [Candidatus Hydrogenedentota bacterium]